MSAKRRNHSGKELMKLKKSETQTRSGASRQLSFHNRWFDIILFFHTWHILFWGWYEGEQKRRDGLSTDGSNLRTPEKPKRKRPSRRFGQRTWQKITSCARVQLDSVSRLVWYLAGCCNVGELANRRIGLGPGNQETVHRISSSLIKHEKHVTQTISHSQVRLGLFPEFFVSRSFRNMMKLKKSETQTRCPIEFVQNTCTLKKQYTQNRIRQTEMLRDGKYGQKNDHG